VTRRPRPEQFGGASVNFVLGWVSAILTGLAIYCAHPAHHPAVTASLGAAGLLVAGLFHSWISAFGRRDPVTGSSQPKNMRELRSVTGHRQRAIGSPPSEPSARKGTGMAGDLSEADDEPPVSRPARGTGLPTVSTCASEGSTSVQSYCCTFLQNESRSLPADKLSDLMRNWEHRPHGAFQRRPSDVAPRQLLSTC
jgi:hypothetical protein